MSNQHGRTNQVLKIVITLTDIEVDVEHPVELNQLRGGSVSLEGDGGGVGEARVVQRHLCK